MDVCTNLTVKNITRSIQVIQIIDSGDPDHPYYVRTSSVGKAPKKQAVVMRGTLKSYRINVYSKNGKIIGTWKKAK